PYAPRPSTPTETLLSPACSPSCSSMISVFQRCRSAQRRYIRRSIAAQSVASVPPAPALMLRIAGRSSYSPENRSWVRSRLKSRSRSSTERSTSASSSASPASWASSRAVSMSSVRARRPVHSSISARRPSASRSTSCAARLSSQKPGSEARWSRSLRRSCLPGRSKTPRGRSDPLHQVADARGVHLVLGDLDAQVLEQDRTELDQAQGRLAPDDDGVHARTVAVVGADAAVAIAVERGGIAAGAAITFAGDQVDEGRFLSLLHESLTSVAAWI